MISHRFYKAALRIQVGAILVLLVCIILISIWSSRHRNPGRQLDPVSPLKIPTSPKLAESSPQNRSRSGTPPGNIGFASYYADEFHGKPTASGEGYEKNAFTAAHRTYPFGTRVRVTNIKTGKSVIVRINDRGPHSQDRIIDLSARAAQEIGLLQKGIMRVKIEVLP